jgi:hypothetical protein
VLLDFGFQQERFARAFRENTSFGGVFGISTGR